MEVTQGPMTLGSLPGPAAVATSQPKPDASTPVPNQGMKYGTTSSSISARCLWKPRSWYSTMLAGFVK